MTWKRIHVVRDLLQKDWVVHFLYQRYLLSKSNIQPNFYISSSPPQDEESSPITQNHVIPTERCSDCAILEPELARYKGEGFPFMIIVKIHYFIDSSNNELHLCSWKSKINKQHGRVG